MAGIDKTQTRTLGPTTSVVPCNAQREEHHGSADDGEFWVFEATQHLHCRRNAGLGCTDWGLSVAGLYGDGEMGGGGVFEDFSIDVGQIRYRQNLHGFVNSGDDPVDRRLRGQISKSNEHEFRTGCLFYERQKIFVF
jgi:hypothetical protein